MTATASRYPAGSSTAFTVRFNGEEALSVALEPAVSSDPYIRFELTLPESGLLEFEWRDDDGSIYSLSREVAVK